MAINNEYMYIFHYIVYIYIYVYIWRQKLSSGYVQWKIQPERELQLHVKSRRGGIRIANPTITMTAKSNTPKSRAEISKLIRYAS